MPKEVLVLLSGSLQKRGNPRKVPWLMLEDRKKEVSLPDGGERMETVQRLQLGFMNSKPLPKRPIS